jgi:hypothetical protein
VLEEAKNMYERSAIVLERYFDNLLEYNEDCNLRDNFNNYCDLVEKLEKYQTNYQKELAATQEFNESIKKVKAIQASQEKLYQKSAKLEYNRNLLFNNIDGKVEDIRKCIEKIEVDVEKNNEAMKETKEKLIAALEVYNEKRLELSKCKRYKKIAENGYNESYETALENYDGIEDEALELAKAFSNFDDIEDIISEMEENGSNEKIPFNQGVIENAAKYSVEIAKKETEGYLIIYDKMTKLLEDIENGSTKIELHKKYLKNEKAKIDFIYSVKEYVVQFLDYERMTIIHGRKSHNRLMSEACEKFNEDVNQINNLYELLEKETQNKATKKAYKELYNQSYLASIQEKEEKFKKEKNRVNLNTATLINSNYWRIEGIKGIYTVFYKTVSEVFEKDIAEFDIPKDVDEENQDDVKIIEDIEDEDKSIAEPTVKIPFEIDSEYEIPIEDFDDIEDSNEVNISSDDELDDNENYTDYDNLIKNTVNKIQEGSDEEEFDIFGEKYRDLDLSDTIPSMKTAKNINFDEEIDDVEEDSIFNNLDDEDEIAKVKPTKRQRKSKYDIEDMDLEEPTSSVIVKKMRKINNVKKKKVDTEDIW